MKSQVTNSAAFLALMGLGSVDAADSRVTLALKAVPSTYLQFCEVSITLESGRQIGGTRGWRQADAEVPTMTTVTHGGVPTRAVDGNLSTHWGDAGCVHSDLGGEWNMAIDVPEPIASIQVYHRSDCCHERNEQVEVGYYDEDGQFISFGLQGSTQASPAVYTKPVVVHERTRSVTLAVEAFPDTYLQFCEIAVGMADGRIIGGQFGWSQLNPETPTLSSIGWGGVPERAIDGSGNTAYNDGSCIHSQLGGKWNMVLEVPDVPEPITSIKVLHRSDCCHERNEKVEVGYYDNGEFHSFDLTNDAQATPAIYQKPVSRPDIMDETNSITLAIEATPDTYLQFCEVALNLADGTKVGGRNGWAQVDFLHPTQTSFGWGGLPDRVIDGNMDTNYGSGSCTHTQLGGKWNMIIDVPEGPEPIDSIEVYHRSDCCHERNRKAAVGYYDKKGQFIRFELQGSTQASPAVYKKPQPVAEKTKTLTLAVEAFPDEYLQFCEVALTLKSGKKIGATHGWAEVNPQSPTQTSFGWGGLPERAVDGNVDTNYGNGSCMHTQKGGKWNMIVDVQEPIASIEIYHRSDCCHERNARIQVGFYDEDGEFTNFRLDGGTQNGPAVYKNEDL